MHVTWSKGRSRESKGGRGFRVQMRSQLWQRKQKKFRSRNIVIEPPQVKKPQMQAMLGDAEGRITVCIALVLAPILAPALARTIGNLWWMVVQMDEMYLDGDEMCLDVDKNVMDVDEK